MLPETPFEDDCCTRDRPCGQHVGGCNDNEECFGGLVCTFGACGTGGGPGSSCCDGTFVIIMLVARISLSLNNKLLCRVTIASARFVVEYKH